MTFSIRRIQIPQDYEQVAELLSVILSEEINAADLSDEDSKIPTKGQLSKNDAGLLTGYDRYRIVAVDDANKLIGYGISWRAPWSAPGELNHVLVVHPEYRGFGIGSKLYANLEQWDADVGANKLNYEVREDDERSVTFANRNGFQIERHAFESVLELANFDKRILDVSRTPVSITSFSEIHVDQKELKLYELYKRTYVDVPGFSGDYFDFDEWKKWTLDLPGSKLEYLLIAIDGNEFVGVAHLLYHESTQSMYNEYTGVDRAYRGQGIGLSLKLKSIELALRLNMKYIRTNNDSLNVPMLRINRDRLGFVAVPGVYKMVKELG